jgi:hypothetical protein
MDISTCVFSIGLCIAILLASPLLSGWHVAEGQNQNFTLSNDTNNTKPVWNMKDRSITLVNPTTNETKVIGNFTVNPANITTNDNLTNMGNIKN